MSEPTMRTQERKLGWLRRRRWVIVRCWAGSYSVAVPQPTKYRFWFHRNAESLAHRLSTGIADGRWYEVERS